MVSNILFQIEDAESYIGVMEKTGILTKIEVSLTIFRVAFIVEVSLLVEVM